MFFRHPTFDVQLTVFFFFFSEMIYDIYIYVFIVLEMCIVKHKKSETIRNVKKSGTQKHLVFIYTHFFF